MITWIFTIVSLIGSFLNAKKIMACWFIWIAVNICWLIYDIRMKLYSRALLDTVQTVFCVIGIIEWRKK